MIPFRIPFSVFFCGIYDSLRDIQGYDKTVINQRMVEKSAFQDQSEENSMWILKWTTLLGMFWKISFTPAVTSCYQVHVLNADAHLSAALLCYFLGPTGAETSLLSTAGYQQPSCLCVKMEFVIWTISLSCELCSISWSCFRSCGVGTTCTENGVSFYMRSAVEVS